MSTEQNAPTSSTTATVAGLPREIKRLKFDGLLFVGDPHMTCVRPGRRVEEDFLEVPLDKIRQAREISQGKNLLTVFVGDMTDNPNKFKAGTERVVEDRGRIIAGFAKAMDFMPCVTVPGNHDKHETRLTPDCTLSQMRDLRLIDVIEPGGAYAVIEIDGQRVGLGGTPYGEPIPKDVRGAFGVEVDKVVWITHDMFIFDHKIPVLRDPPEIKGVDLAVNGHDHESQKPRTFGQTTWHNIGNITRMAVDCADHVPSVWQWDPTNGMKQHVLEYNKNAFNLVGLQVEADAKGAHQIEQKREKSLFSQLLLADQANQQERTDSGDMIKEDMERVISDMPHISELARLMVRNLHLRAPERMKATP